MTLPAVSTGGSETESASLPLIKTLQTGEPRELKKESEAARLPSLHNQSDTSAPANPILSPPIDLTIPAMERNETPEEPQVAAEGLDTTRAWNISAMRETVVDADSREDTEELINGGGRIVGQEEALMETILETDIAGPPSPRGVCASFVNCDGNNVKTESEDDHHLLRQKSLVGSGLDFLDVVYHVETAAIFCRLCMYVCDFSIF
jgi:hypothetical protein